MPRRIRPTLSSEHGAVTAEFAVVLPAVVVVIAMILVLARFTMVSMACQDAAAVVVRELVIAQDSAAAQAPTSIARRVAGDDTEVSLSYQSDAVVVETRCPVVPDPLRLLPQQAVGKATGVLNEGGG